MTPKPLLLAVLLGILLPMISFSQQFSANNLILRNDQELFFKELTSVSPLLQTIISNAESRKDMSIEEATTIIETRLRALKDPNLDKLFAEATTEQKLKWGMIMYLMINGISNVYSGTEGQLMFGGALGVFMMYTIAKFVLMPELMLAGRGYGEKNGSAITKTKFLQLALALTALYVVQASTLNLVFGISPTLAYIFSGKYIYDNDTKENVEFDGQNGANRIAFYLGINAGILLRNAIMIRLIYSLGISKIYKNQDATMFMWALAFNIPFSIFSEK